MPEYSAADLLRLKRRLILLFSAVAAGLVAAAAVYDVHHRRDRRRDAQELLLSMEEFKLDQLDYWRQDKINDAVSLLQGAGVRASLNALEKDRGDAQAAAWLKERLTVYARNYQYLSAAVTDAAGRVLISVGKKFLETTPETRRLISLAGKSGKPEVGEFNLSHGEKVPHITLTAPAFGPGAKPELYLVLRIDPAAYIFPLIYKWPVRTRTGETVLARKEGNDVLFLSRRRVNAPERIPVGPDTATLPAAAGLAGYSGIMRGRDYHGADVLAVVGIVPGTSWVMVTKMDWNEVMAGTAKVSVMIALTTLALLGAAAGGALLLFRRQTEEYRRSYAELETNYELLNDRANDGILIADLDTMRIIKANRMACRIYGYTPEEMIGLYAETVIPDSDIDAFKERIALNIGAGQRIYEARHRRKDGQVFPVEISASVVSSGRRRLMFIVVRDISERKKAEAELQESESRYRNVSSVISDIAYSCRAGGDGAYRIDWITGAAEENLGYTTGEIKARGCWKFLVAEEDRAVFDAKVVGLAPGESALCELRLRRKDGKQIWAESFAKCTEEGAGGAMLFGGLRNITARKRAEAEVQEREQVFSQFMEHSPVYVFFKDEEIRATRLSRNYETLLGRQMKELIGKNMYDLFPSELAKGMVEDDKRILADDKEVTVEEEFNGRRYRTIKFPIAVEGKPRQLAGFTMDITEQEAAKEQLARLNERMTLAARAAGIGVWDWDIVNNVLTWDDRMYDLYGVGKEAPAPKYEMWLAKVHPEDRAAAGEASRRALAERRPYDTEFRVLLSDGKVRHMRAVADVFRDPSGKPVRMVGVNLDITEAKLAKEKLQASEEQLRVTLEESQIGTWAWDVKNDIWQASPTYYTMLGYPPVAGPSDRSVWLERVHPEDREMVAEKIKGVLRGADVKYQYEARMRHADGSYRWHAVLGNTVSKDERGLPARILGVRLDINERKLAEEAVRRSEEKYRTIFEESFDTLFLTSPDGHILDMNRKGVSLFGYGSKDEILKLDLARDVYAEPPDRARILAMVNAQGAAEYDVWVKKRSGERILAHCALTAVKNAKGDITQYRGILRDITEKKLAEEALIKSEKGLKEAQRLAKIGNWELDLATNKLSWSDEIYQIFELDSARFGASYEAFLNAIHPEDRGLVNKAYTDSVKNRTRYDIIHRLLMADGRIKYVNECCETIYGSDGRPLKSVGTVQDITERVRAEQERGHLLERLNLAKAAAHLGVWDWNIKEDELSWDDKMYELYGVRKEDFGRAYEAWASALHPEDRAQMEEFTRRALAGEVPYDTEFRVKLTGGEVRHIKAIAGIYRDAAGRPVRMVGVNMDITERKLSEEALKKSESSLIEAQRLARIGNWEWNIATDKIRWSKEYYHIYGLDPDKPPPGYAEHLKAYTPESAAVLDAAVKRNMETGEPYQVDLELADPKGPTRWITARSESVRDASGKITGLRGTAQDITERKRAEEALRQSEERLRSLWTHMAEGVALHELVYDASGKPANYRIIETNPQFEAILGIKTDHVSGKLATEAYGTAEAPYLLEYAAVVESGQPTALEVYFEPLKKYFSISIAPWGTAGFATIFSDITARKLAELETDRLNKELVAKNQEMESFLYVTTHDLRSPLVNIEGFSQNLRGYMEEFHGILGRLPGLSEAEKGRLAELSASKCPEALNFVLESSRKMDVLITALLKVSRVGRAELKPERLNVTELFKRILDAMRFQLQEAGAEVRTGILPDCIGDAVSVNQLFSNLLDNAVKHRDRSRPLAITVQGELKGTSAVYSVSDNGPGIAAADTGKIWDMFYRPAGPGQTKGEGIGLPLAKRIAERNGGKITVESKEGEGTLFRVELPAA